MAVMLAIKLADGPPNEAGNAPGNAPLSEPAPSLRIINHALNERKPMRALASLLAIAAIAVLGACSNLPMSSSAQSGQVQHPDVFHSYVD